MSQNKNQAPVVKSAGAQKDVVHVRTLKTCFIKQLRFPGEVFETDKKEVYDANGNLIAHFQLVDANAKSEQIEENPIGDNPYGTPPVLREDKKQES